MLFVIVSFGVQLDVLIYFFRFFISKKLVNLVMLVLFLQYKEVLGKGAFKKVYGILCDLIISIKGRKFSFLFILDFIVGI